MTMTLSIGLYILFGCFFYNPVKCEVIQLNEANINKTLAKYELVFINFYVDWCRYSKLMQPIFDEAARLVDKEFGKTGRIAMCKVDCDVEVGIARRFTITKYPTLKITLNGDIIKREYRGQRSIAGVVEFVRNQLKDPVKKIIDVDELKRLDATKRTVVGYFDGKDIPEYNIFRRVAANLKDDCDFYAGFGETVAKLHVAGQSGIIFRPDVALSHEKDESYTGKIKLDELKTWAQEKCIPLVREITFDNAEELTEEGMPFMILFYHPNNTLPIKDYKAIVASDLISEKQNINFLIADGKRFAHPLDHLEKTIDELPVIAIDSFRHMYLFPDYNDIHTPGKLKQFVDDLHSGKLHREFHYGPDPVEKKSDSHDHDHEDDQLTQPSESSSKSTPTEDKDHIHNDNDESSPPDSTFIKLAPSDKRYTIVRGDEL